MGEWWDDGRAHYGHAKWRRERREKKNIRKKEKRAGGGKEGLFLSSLILFPHLGCFPHR